MQTWHKTWQPIRSVLQSSFPHSMTRLIVLEAGLVDLDKWHRSIGGAPTKERLLVAIEVALSSAANLREAVMKGIVCEILARQPDLANQLDVPLQRLGLAVVEGDVVSLDVLDPLDLEELPRASSRDLVKAASRFRRDGDRDGAVSAACGAVESATAAVYESNGEEGHEGASFQEKVKVALKLTGVLERTRLDLVDLGWEQSKVKLLVKNLETSLNAAAYVMQQLRTGMGDVHGSKPTLDALAFESVKWAEVLARMLAEDRA